MVSFWGKAGVVDGMASDHLYLDTFVLMGFENCLKETPTARLLPMCLKERLNFMMPVHPRQFYWKKRLVAQSLTLRISQATVH
jgi:hypothetical protein